MKNNIYIQTLGRLLFYANKKKLYKLLLLVLIVAFFEIISISLMVPFLTLVSGIESGESSKYIVFIAELFGNEKIEIQKLTIVISIVIISSIFLRIFLNYVLVKSVFGYGHKLGSEVYNKVLHQNYSYHVENNSSIVLSGIAKIEDLIEVVLITISGVSSAILAILIFFTLVYISPYASIILISVFLALYFSISLFTKEKLIDNGQQISNSTDARFKSIKEGVGGIRDVIIDRLQSVFLSEFNRQDLLLRKAQISNNIIAPTPRYIVEGLSMLLIIGAGYYVSLSEGGLMPIIPIFGALVIGVQRLLPMINQAYHGWALFSGHIGVINDVMKLAELKSPLKLYTKDSTDITYKKNIEIKGVNFTYELKNNVIRDLNIKIEKGDVVGVTGVSGSGKSTFVDVLMGLLSPSEGCILIDGVRLDKSNILSWQSNISHMSQHIHLVDGTIEDNIAIGVPHGRIDNERLAQCIKVARLDKVVDSMENGVKASVGEDGAKLSGGQRQRIGIARMLYKTASLLVLDEATSALDLNNELKIITNLKNSFSDVTILIISHRQEVLDECDYLISFRNGLCKRMEPGVY